MNKKWEYMGKIYPLNIMSESCFRSVSRRIAELSHAIRCSTPGDGSVCQIIRSFFEGLFGEEAADAICGGGDCMKTHVFAYISFIGFLCSEIDKFSSIREGAAI